jgi:Zn-finger nucleic acid-binding protein
MDCPVCKTERLSMMARQGIEIDYCPKCRGVWLDRGELDKIVERSVVELAAAVPVSAPATVAAPQPSAPQAEYGHGGHRARHDDRYAGGHRRKSFLQDLFD